MINEIEKIFYNPGDLVRVRHRKLSNVPVMYVVEKVTRSYKHNDEILNSFKGIKCRWFNVSGDLWEESMSSTDLERVK